MVSNLGRLNIPVQYGHLRLEAMYGPSIISHFKNNHLVGVITLGDQLFFNFVYSKLEIKKAQAEQVQKEAMKLLLATNKVKTLAKYLEINKA
ncbi:hypothetical protein [Gloeothece verrucosa]|uniref:hypothetical protein n=1 Tax=Gloeothece verrucosa TaxID=2546359 RepID=UPI0005A55AB4|nr:hypothetical protein [Gloeothece verrucosa]